MEVLELGSRVLSTIFNREIESIPTTLASIFVLVAGSYAAYDYFKNSKSRRINEEKERLAEQWAIDDKANEEYNDIMQLFIQYPKLDQHDSRPKHPSFQTRQYRIYEQIIDIFERTYKRINDFKRLNEEQGEDNAELERMLQGWEAEFAYWLARKNFRDDLPQLLDRMDPEFIKYFENLARQIDVSPAPKPRSLEPDK